jgi:hypothetical protein
MSDHDAISQSPMLPSGEVITAKNTLQSFVDSPRMVMAYADPVTEIPSAEGQICTYSTSTNSALSRPDPPDVSHNIVRGTSRDDVVAQNISQDCRVARNSKNRLCVGLSVCLFVVVAAAVGIGGFCSSNGACGKDSNDNGKDVVGTGGENRKDGGDNISKALSSSEIITSYINSITLSGRTISLNGTTPEDLAMQWIVDDYAARETFSLDSDQAKIMERYALAALLFQGNRPDVYGVNADLENATNATVNWLITNDECAWSGVFCSDSGEIVNVTLPAFSGDAGSIPSDLGLLTTLIEVQFEGQNFGGTIPNDIGRLSNLQRITLANNFVSGPLPVEMLNWTVIEYLHFESNKIGPTIPEWIGWLTTLTHLNLGGNRFEGTIPFDLGRLTALEHIYLKDNALKGPIQSSFARWASTQYFGISRNQLTGTLPSFIGRWTNVTYFSVGNNQMIGTIPESIGNWSNAKRIHFYDNSFTGTVPIGICSYSDTIITLIADCDVRCSCCTNCTL